MSLQGHTLTLIEETIPALKGNNLKIAQYTMENPKEITTSTIAQFSKKLSISESGIVRFTQELGFSGFSAFKIGIAQSLAKQPESIEDMSISLDCKNPLQITESIFYQATLQLKKTVEMIDEDLLQHALQWIKDCDQLHFYAVGTSAFLAEDAAYRFMRVGVPAQSATDPHIMLFSANHLTPKSVAIAISHTGRSKETIEAMKMANHAGAITICITSTRNSPITQVCKYNFITSDSKQEVVKEAITSRISHIALLDSIFTALMILNYENYAEKLQEVHTILEKARQA